MKDTWKIRTPLKLPEIKVRLSSISTGDIGELAVSLDLAKRGYQVLMPFSSSCLFDIAFCRSEKSRIERVQVKTANCFGDKFEIKIRRTNRLCAYEMGDIDWFAIYEMQSESIFYLKQHHFGGRTSITIDMNDNDMKEKYILV